MRTIKFRGKRVDHEECTPPYKWVYGYYFKTPLTAENCGCDSFLSGIAKYCIATENGVVYEILPETVGQFTGLLDRSGKDIYEGDIVSVPYVNPLGEIDDEENEDYRIEVGFEVGRFVVYGIEPKPLTNWCRKREGEYVSNYGNKIIIEKTTLLKIIGNRFENPELIN